MVQEEIKQLKLLKEKLENQKMSVLIGAGFSKNVSHIFPSWWELLFDMTYFLFQSEIEEAYENIVNSKRGIHNKKEDFVKDKINYYISTNGYLDIVSRFIKRKGYREAITSYIEEKTPNIINQDRKSFLINTIGGKKNKLEIKKEMLSQHRLLLQLPWNNIYTTNYDELLEFANDSLTFESISGEIKIIEKEINDLQDKKLNRRLEELQNQYNSISNEIEEIEGDAKLLASKLDRLEKLKTKLQSKQNDEGKLRFALNENVNAIRNKERELLQLRKALDHCISIVTNSSELSVKRNKNIIKLHGSLRKKNSEYGFDGDIQKHYVIAKEDYDTYPIKHEAFTQLMRISLLQESYCLIGFSGDDTNFLEWINWVREILERDKNINRDYKIYLISVSTSQLSVGKQLFFENHRVFPINIMEDRIIDFLEYSTQYKLTTRTDPKLVIELFFKYLRGKLLVNLPKAIFEIVQVSRYKRYWNLLGSLNSSEFSFQIVRELSKNIPELKKFYRLPSLSFANSGRKHNLLFCSALLIEKAATKPDKENLLKLILIALKDSYLIPTDFVWKRKELERINGHIEKSGKSIQNEFLKIRLREFVLQRNVTLFGRVLTKLSKRKDDTVKYETILMKAFSFDFEGLKVELNSWKPKPDWIVKKAGLLALFDSTKASEYIYEKLGSYETDTQNELYMLEMYRYLQQSIHYEFDKDLNESINSYKKVGLTSISENLDILIEDMKKNKTTLKRYGDGRFGISNSFSFSNDFTHAQKGLQFIQVLIETGLPISISNISWKNSIECYPLFKVIFEYFPYPAIFYALQYSDEKFLRRFGQDYAYSSNLDNLDDILKVLLEAYLSGDIPNPFKQSILYFSSELFIATEPKSWQDYFLKIWRSETFRTRSIEKRWSAEQIFIKSCVPYIQKLEIITEFIYSVLQFPPSKVAVEYLYHLAKNPLLEKKGEGIQSKELESRIDALIEYINQNETAIFMVGNIHAILKSSQKKIILKKLNNIDFNMIQNGRVWRVIAYFSKDENKIVNKVKASILKNKNLFNAGFTDQGLSSGINFIEISQLTDPGNLLAISWEKNEAIQIFNRINSELIKIEKWLAKRENDFKFILHEMLLFLDYERSKVENIESYQTVYDKVESLYRKNRGYDSLIDGLLSSDKSTVIWALGELSMELHEDKMLNGLDFEINAFLNKILLQSEPSLEACLNYLSSWINSDKLAEAFKKYCGIISRILDKYTQFELEEFDKPFVYNQLIIIAKKLDDWGIKSENINHWKEYEQQSRFNNIKFRI